MPSKTSETSPFDVWSESAFDESVLDEEPVNEDDESDATDAEEPEDENDANTGEDAEGKADPKEVTDADKLVEERVNALLEAALKGDPDTPLYKGMQRVLAQRERVITEQNDLADKVIAKNQVLEDELSQMRQGMEILTKLTLANLPADEQAQAVSEFQKAYIDNLQKQNELLRTGGEKKPEAKPEAPEGDNGAFEARVKEYLSKFREGRRKQATKAGLDPDDEMLDYGSDDVPVVDRIEQFEASLEKALEAKRRKSIDEVSQKNDVVPTRNGAGGSIKQSSLNGKTTLQRGSAARIAELRKIAGI